MSFGCVTIRSAVLFILRSRLLLYSTGAGVNRVQVVLSRQKLYVGMVVCISWLHSCLCVDVIWCSWWWFVRSVSVE